MKYEKIALEKIGEAIATAMTERGINKGDLAKKSGEPIETIEAILKGEEYGISSLIRVMRILQIHLELSLLSEDNNIWTTTGNKPSQN